MPELKTSVPQQQKEAFKRQADQYELSEHELLRQVIAQYLQNTRNFKPVYKVKILQVNR